MEDRRVCRGEEVHREGDYGVIIVGVRCEVGSSGKAVCLIRDTRFVHERNWILFPFCNVTGDARTDLMGVSVVLQVCVVGDDNGFVVFWSSE
jgi:hypothetical protein